VQLNDWHVKNYAHASDSNSIVYLDLPGDNAKDMRARRFEVTMSKELTKSEHAHLVASEAPILRSVYRCAEACCRNMDDEEERDAREKHGLDFSDGEGQTLEGLKPTGIFICCRILSE
jgi:hypothetical protein